MLLAVTDAPLTTAHYRRWETSFVRVTHSAGVTLAAASGHVHVPNPERAKVQRLPGATHFMSWRARYGSAPRWVWDAVALAREAVEAARASALEAVEAARAAR